MTEAKYKENREEFVRFWQEAIAELYAPLLVYATKLLKKVNVGEPADLIQTVALRFLKYAIDPATLKVSKKSYLYGSLRNAWFDEIRKSGVRMVQSLTNPVDSKELEKLLPSVEPAVLASRKREEFKQEFEKLGPLTEKEKEIVSLVTQGFTIEEIAEFWGEDLYRTKTRWQRLLSKQRYRIKKRNEREAATKRK